MKSCEYCGEEVLPHPTGASYSRKRFCNSTCQVSAWKGKTCSGVKAGRQMGDSEFLSFLMEEVKQ